MGCIYRCIGETSCWVSANVFVLWLVDFGNPEHCTRPTDCWRRPKKLAFKIIKMSFQLSMIMRVVLQRLRFRSLCNTANVKWPLFHKKGVTFLSSLLPPFSRDTSCYTHTRGLYINTYSFHDKVFPYVYCYSCPFISKFSSFLFSG